METAISVLGIMVMFVACLFVTYVLFMLSAETLKRYNDRIYNSGWAAAKESIGRNILGHAHWFNEDHSTAVLLADLGKEIRNDGCINDVVRLRESWRLNRTTPKG